MTWQTLSIVVPTAISAAVYAGAQTSFAWTMLRRKRLAKPRMYPRVSLLKPMAGVDDGLLVNLASFAALDYPAYEILFGVASPSDPAADVVRKFIAAHPELSAKLVVTDRSSRSAYNPKVAQLIELTKHARGSVLVVSDANIRVPPSYLASIVAKLLEPGVGLVSSVIVGAGEKTLGAALENAQLGAYVAPGIVAAHRLGIRPATIGKSMAMRDVDLARVGGWESVAKVLAEDDALAQRFDRAGYRVELCLEPNVNQNERTSVWKSIERHARWAKMRRAFMPFGFTAEPLLLPLIVATWIAMAAPSVLSARMWLWSLGVQVLGTVLSLTALGVRRAWRLAALEPLRTFAVFIAWALAWTTRRVAWRGHAFVIGEGTRLIPVEGEGTASALEP